MNEFSSKTATPIKLTLLRKPEAPPWSCGTLPTPAGSVFRVSTEWSRTDHWGQIKSRVSAFRMRYSVRPGLYAIGDPGADSDVLVSANYKLSFDILRRELRGLHAWILVLDTKSINVWCAAGKGTFGTAELIKRIRETRLEKIVSHRRVIVPQLGAPGINAATVRKETGFRVSFGPVHAGDIPGYVRSGYRATREMRTVKFTLRDRLVLTPMEINPAMKRFPLFALIVLLIMGLQPSGIQFRDAWHGGLPLLVLGLVSVLSGAFFTPLLLPFIPFRAFSVKGWILGILAVAAMHGLGVLPGNTMLIGFSYLFFPLASSYIALQFTGSTTFTGMSGVKKELKIGVPVYVTGAAASLILLVVFKLLQWGVV